ncbi:hypothetical protein CLU79DRAFT_765750 [Phycomyces nitens]|nr:hypothetical protein CLU79DRAFT_765750 [Phycomyces nitens]
MAYHAALYAYLWTGNIKTVCALGVVRAREVLKMIFAWICYVEGYLMVRGTKRLLYEYAQTTQILHIVHLIYYFPVSFFCSCSSLLPLGYYGL